MRFFSKALRWYVFTAQEELHARLFFRLFRLSLDAFCNVKLSLLVAIITRREAREMDPK